MSSPEVEVEIGRVGGPERGRRVRSVGALLAVPLALVALVAIAVLGARPARPAVSPPSPSAPAVAPTGWLSEASVPPVDLALDVPRGQVPLDFTHRPLPGVASGLTGTAHADLAARHSYTVLVRCLGPGRIDWPSARDPSTIAPGFVPCDGAAHAVGLAGLAGGSPATGIDFSFDLAADTHIVVVETPAQLPNVDVVAVPLAADGSRPAVLGAPTDAVTVAELRDQGIVTGLVVRRLSLSGAVTTLAVVPQSAFPPSARPTLYNGSSAISRNGFLAVPFEAEDESEEVAVFDLTDPLAEAAVVGDRATGFGWGPDGQLAVARSGGIGVFDPLTRRVDAVPIGPGLDAGARFTWTTDARFAATRMTGGAVELGELRGDGAFLPGSWPLFDPLGIERPWSSDGRSLGTGCEDAPTGGGCYLVVGHGNRDDYRPWPGGLPRYADAAPDALWTAPGDSIWLLHQRRVAGSSRRFELRLSQEPKSSALIAEFTVRAGGSEPIDLVGASADDAALAIGIDTREVVVVDTRTGRTARVDGAFAGWGDTRSSVYPFPPAG